MALSDKMVSDGSAYNPPRPTAMQLAEGSGVVDPNDPPAETPVRLLASVGTTLKPQVLAGRTSSTGKTLSITRDGVTHRLSAAELFAGETIRRDGFWYELYTLERYQTRREAVDMDPSDDPPAATHQPSASTTEEYQGRNTVEVTHR